MIENNPQLKALLETSKEFLRWAISFFIGWLLDNGYTFFTNSRLSPDVIFVIGAIFRAADYYWHKYNKEIQPENKNQSMGLIGF